jgi:hypothetical protein
MTRRQRWKFAAILVLAAVGACGTQPHVDDPIGRKFTWGDFLAGGDIRRSCDSRRSDIYRFVYNGVYGEQVRIYEVAARPDRSGGEVHARVLNAVNLLDPDLFRTDKLIRGVESRLAIDREELRRIDRAVADEAAVRAAPPGTFLPSDRFYWTFSRCLDGVFGFSAFVYPFDGRDVFEFPKELLRYDLTGVQVNYPRAFPHDVIFQSDYGYRRHNRSGAFTFLYRTTENGI